MTFCLSMKMADGLVAIADTRITSGSEILSARKLSIHEVGGGSLFLMTSGLRSVRDKTVTYFEEELEKEGKRCDRLYKAVNLFGLQLRRTADEDRLALSKAHLEFNLYGLMGGRLKNDKGHFLYLIYPQGNWVEINESRPYHIIGETNFGRPILDRTFKHSDGLLWALKVGCLAFDSTRISANDVDFPIDIAIYDSQSGKLREGRFDREDLQKLSSWWSDRIRASVAEMPEAWLQELADKVTEQAPEARGKKPPGKQKKR
jgi:putative proteasome-type protease